MTEKGRDPRAADRGPSAEAPAALPPILVSACLLGVRCNHRGEDNRSDAVVALGRGRRLIPVCPETAGGLPTPRPPAEQQPDGSVRTDEGVDVSDAFRRGAEHAVRLAVATGATAAVLKARSPSCGCHEVYDGTFSGVRVAGAGVTAAALAAGGVAVFDEEDVEEGALRSLDGPDRPGTGA